MTDKMIPVLREFLEELRDCAELCADHVRAHDLGEDSAEAHFRQVGRTCDALLREAEQPCGCRIGTCESNADRRCRMADEIAEQQARPTDEELRRGVEQTAAARDVLAERQRQISAEGWTPEHDDEHDAGELAGAAAAYTLAACDEMNPYSQGDGDYLTNPPDPWPMGWDASWWRPSVVPRRNLVKAGALILAEIERMDRAALAAEKRGDV